MLTAVPAPARPDHDYLLARLRARDDHAADELLQQFRPRVLRMALRVLRNPEDAEEVTQDVFVKVCRKVDSFRGDSALGSWIHRIAANAIVSRLRRTKGRQAVSLVALPAEAEREPCAVAALLDWSDLADDLVMRRQLRCELARAIRELPAIYRAPIVLRDVRGLTTEQASRRLRVKDETLKSRLHRGRTMLRRRLANFASGIALHRVA